MAERLQKISHTCPIFECARRGTFWIEGHCAGCMAPFEVELTRGHDLSDNGAYCPHCKNTSVFGHKFLREGQQRG